LIYKILLIQQSGALVEEPKGLITALFFFNNWEIPLLNLLIKMRKIKGVFYEKKEKLCCCNCRLMKKIVVDYSNRYTYSVTVFYLQKDEYDEESRQNSLLKTK
jgi:hypothetical protein